MEIYYPVLKLLIYLTGCFYFFGYLLILILQLGQLVFDLFTLNYPFVRIYALFFDFVFQLLFL